MNWKSFFTPSKSISSDDARKYLKNHDITAYQLLDVRQPQEYEQHHLPGAILMPIKEIGSRIEELNKEKPTLIYCHSGMRSKAAAQLLQGNGFKTVLTIRGGIKAWKGLRVHGPETQGMEFFTSGEFEDACHMAYRMEMGLKQFYLALAEEVDLQSQKDLLHHMAAYEDGHMAMLRHQFKKNFSSGENLENVSEMEGGFDKNTILTSYGDHIESMEDIIHLGMMFETEAYDLYCRLARKADNSKTRDFYQHMAREEIIHLGQLSRELDKIYAGLRPEKP
jgi:rhodanese-related sulfurtransferase